MFIDPVAFHAVRRPDDVAIALPYDDISYRDFDTAINKVANALLPHVDAGARVAVAVEDLHLQWLLKLALGRVGAVSAKVPLAARQTVLTHLKPDLVLSERPPFDGHPGSFLSVDFQWLGDVLTHGDATSVHRVVDLDTPVHISFSSGTTGIPKKIQFSHRLLMRRVTFGIFTDPGIVHKRLLTLVGGDAFGGFASPLSAWWAGGTVGLFPALPYLIANRRITSIVASPRQIEELVAKLPANFQRMEELTLALGGSGLAPQLAQAVMQRLAGQTISVYGATESGTIASMPLEFGMANPGASGIVLPWNEVQALDEKGTVLPPGEVGEIRIRTQLMADGYLDDPEATEQHFRDGWFYPGDVGSVSASGVLAVLGRVDDVVNFGGVKMGTARVENALREVEGILDAGVHVEADDRTALVASLVTEQSFDMDGVQRRLQETLQVTDVRVRFVRVPSIPRNAMGKIDRRALREQAQQFLQAAVQ